MIDKEARNRLLVEKRQRDLLNKLDEVAKSSKSTPPQDLTSSFEYLGSGTHSQIELLLVMIQLLQDIGTSIEGVKQAIIDGNKEDLHNELVEEKLDKKI